MLPAERLTHYLDALILYRMDSLKNRNCIQSLKVKVILLLVLKGDELLLSQSGFFFHPQNDGGLIIVIWNFCI